MEEKYSLELKDRGVFPAQKPSRPSFSGELVPMSILCAESQRILFLLDDLNKCIISKNSIAMFKARKTTS
jgi:hypothetical protein